MVTRGNVAIYCYNALTAKTWDVTESTDGQLTSSKTSDTILEKYFSDFVNEAGDMKLVENATVVLSGANTTDIGENQIKLTASIKNDKNAEIGIAGFIDAERAPKKGKEEVTYVSGTDVIAYVAEGVADLSVLAGKEVDVIFGRDNEVVYVKVTDDAIDKAFVTAWDLAEAEIEIDGEVYEVNADAVVSIFGYNVTNYVDSDNDEVIDLDDSYTAVEAIDDLLVEHNYAIAKPTKVFNRSVLANIILDEDGDIRYVNFIGSLNGQGNVYVNGATTPTALQVNEAIVEKISKTGVITTIDTSLVSATKVEELDDAKVTVIKNNEVVSAEEIEAGNVLTIIKLGNDVKTIYVSDAVVEGTIEKVKNDTVTIDGTVYNTTKTLIGNTNGELDKATSVNNVETYFEEDVVAYLNFVGEVAAVVAESEATNATLGMVVRAAALRTDDSDVDYLSLKILTADGSKATYKIYAEDEDDTLTATDYIVGDMVLFTADADKVITLYDNAADNKAEGIYEVLGTEAKLEIDGTELELVKLAATTEGGTTPAFTTDYDKQTLTQGSTYRFNSSAVLFNKYDDGTTATTADRYEIAKGWTSICDKTTNALNIGAYLLVDGSRVKYAVFSAANYMSDTNNYAVLVDVEYKRNADDDKVYFATLFVDGEEVEYELDSKNVTANVEIGDLVNYTISDEEITVMDPVVKTADVADVAIDAAIASGKVLNYLYGTDTNNDGTDDNGNAKYLTYVKGQFEVADVDEGYIYFAKEVVLNPAYDAEKDANNDGVVTGGTGKEDTAASTDVNKYLPAIPELVVDEDGCIIYDLRDGSWEMFDGAVEDIEGLCVAGYLANGDNADIDILVIFE